MQKKLILLTVVLPVTNPEMVRNTEMAHTFFNTTVHDTPAGACAAVTKLFEKERIKLSTEQKEEFFSPDNEPFDLKDIYTKNKGYFWAAFNGLIYRFQFVTIEAEYSADANEVYSALDGYLNSTRGGTEYKKLSELIVRNMHRYVQSNLWKFIKHLIRAIAEGGYDERNETAHTEAGQVKDFLEQQVNYFL